VPVAWIPSLLRDLTGGETTIAVEGRTVREVIDALEARFPGIQARLCEGDRLRPTISVIVDGQVSRQKLRQSVGEASEVHFMPAISGGSGPPL
jgi:molybdopterin synthase sulfur carrier subunit